MNRQPKETEQLNYIIATAQHYKKYFHLLLEWLAWWSVAFIALLVTGWSVNGDCAGDGLGFKFVGSLLIAGMCTLLRLAHKMGHEMAEKTNRTAAALDLAVEKMSARGLSFRDAASTADIFHWIRVGDEPSGPLANQVVERMRASLWQVPESDIDDAYRRLTSYLHFTTSWLGIHGSDLEELMTDPVFSDTEQRHGESTPRQRYFAELAEFASHRRHTARRLVLVKDEFAERVLKRECSDDERRVLTSVVTNTAGGVPTYLLGITGARRIFEHRIGEPGMEDLTSDDARTAVESLRDCALYGKGILVAFVRESGARAGAHGSAERKSGSVASGWIGTWPALRPVHREDKGEERTMGLRSKCVLALNAYLDTWEKSPRRNRGPIAPLERISDNLLREMRATASN